MSDRGNDRTLESMRVEELMIPLDRYPQVTTDTTLAEAARVLKAARIDFAGHRSLPRSVLVFSPEGQLVGSVRRRDIMRGLEPKHLLNEPLDYRKKLFDVKLDPELSELSYDHLISEVREQATRPVKRVMKPLQVTIHHDDHLIKAIYEMVSYGISLLPVLKERRVVGVVRSVELFEALTSITD